MKKIINGKKYDTETATEVGFWKNMGDTRNFGYVCEILYRKRTGEYFLYGEGNAASKYAKSLGDNTWCGGETITPLTIDSAREWAEKHLDSDEYEKEFGEVSEDETFVIYARVDGATKSKLRRYMEDTGLNASQAIERIIAETPVMRDYTIEYYTHADGSMMTMDGFRSYERDAKERAISLLGEIDGAEYALVWPSDDEEDVWMITPDGEWTKVEG